MPDLLQGAERAAAGHAATVRVLAMNGGAAATGGGPLKAIRAHFAPPPSGARYILFEAVRYVYNAERCRFERAAVCAGKTCVRAAPRAPTALVGSFGSPHAAKLALLRVATPNVPWHV